MARFRSASGSGAGLGSAGLFEDSGSVKMGLGKYSDSDPDLESGLYSGLGLGYVGLGEAS